jgi:hypothetical protein
MRMPIHSRPDSEMWPIFLSSTVPVKMATHRACVATTLLSGSPSLKSEPNHFLDRFTDTPLAFQISEFDARLCEKLPAGQGFCALYQPE